VLTRDLRSPWIFTAERVIRFIICLRNPYRLVLSLVSSPPRSFVGLLKIRFTEKASIDECFIDFTRPVREELLRRYPHLAQAPRSGADTPLPPPSTPTVWNANTSLVPIGPKDNDTEHLGEPSASTHVDPLEEPPITWHDVALSIAAEMMQTARDQVRAKLGYSTSAVCVSLPHTPLVTIPTRYLSQGIARNKFLAKV